MDSSVITGVLAFAGTLAGVVFAAWKFRKSQVTATSTTSYDQIQEDLKGMRDERKTDREAAIAEREKDRAAAAQDRQEMLFLQQLIRHLDDEVVGLRLDVQAGIVPPLKPRTPWPARVELPT